jgi:hypothetical protein
MKRWVPFAAAGVLLLIVISACFLIWMTASLRWANLVTIDRAPLHLRDATVQVDDDAPFRSLPPMTAILRDTFASTPTPTPTLVPDAAESDDDDDAAAPAAPALMLEDIPMFTPLRSGR